MCPLDSLFSAASLDSLTTSLSDSSHPNWGQGHFPVVVLCLLLRADCSEPFVHAFFWEGDIDISSLKKCLLRSLIHFFLFQKPILSFCWPSKAGRDRKINRASTLWCTPQMAPTARAGWAAARSLKLTLQPPVRVARPQVPEPSPAAS